MSEIFTANKNTLTLHIRITKKCNADCSYCSSYEANASDLMSLNDLDKSLDFLKEKIINLGLGGSRNNLTVQYIGGELLSVPVEYLSSFSSLVKEKLSPLFKNFRHGGQSNLIGSFRKVNELIELFDGNIGSSYDNFTEQRTVQKNSKLYRSIFLKNISQIKKQYGKTISGVVVLDKKMSSFIKEEINLAHKRKSHITLRPVFNGGSPVEKLTINDLETIYEELFDDWFLKQDIIIEPFFSYLQRRLHKYTNQNIEDISGCPSQHNCATVSLNLEPDGSIFVCQDMADSQSYKIGNAIDGIWNEQLFNQIKLRSEHLHSSCLSCDYFKECQGGCMKEAIEQTPEGIYGKTLYCSIWKKIFFKIDKAIENNSFEKINNWIEAISKY